MTPVFLDAFLKVSSAMEEFPTCPPGFPSHLFLILYQSHCLSPMLLIMQLNCEAKLSVQHFAFADITPPDLYAHWGGGQSGEVPVFPSLDCKHEGQQGAVETKGLAI